MIERITSGHERLDALLGGGLPANGINLIIGHPGTGKTILAEQYLFHNAQAGPPGRLPVDGVGAVRQDPSLRRIADVLRRRRDRHVGLLRRSRRGRQPATASPASSTRSTRCSRSSSRASSSSTASRRFGRSPSDEAEFRRFLHDLAGRLTAVAASVVLDRRIRPQPGGRRAGVRGRRRDHRAARQPDRRTRAARPAGPQAAGQRLPHRRARVPHRRRRTRRVPSPRRRHRHRRATRSAPSASRPAFPRSTKRSATATGRAPSR